MTAPATGPSEWPSGNYLLARVPPADQPKLAPVMETVTLTHGQLLYSPGDPLTHVYLPTSGMISLIAVMGDGRRTQTMTVGREGAVAMSASGYVDPAFHEAVVQVDGEAQRVAAADFEDMIDNSVGLCSAVTRYREVFIRTTLQAVACNALHHVRSRCARWILTTQDRSRSEHLPLTQELLAEMLGVKRNAISVVARDFQRQGLVAYTRGRFIVLDRAAIEAEACECYTLITAELNKLATDKPSPECDD